MNTPPRSFAAPPPPSTPDAKARLRGEMRVRRRELKAAAPDAAAMAAQGWATSRMLTPKVAAVYHPRGAEMDPAPLAAALRDGGAAVVLPVALAPDEPLTFREAGHGDAFEVDAAGVPAPAAAAPERRPDLVFAPLLAFDAWGGRLGQGGGFYDRTIAALRKWGEVRVLGLAYAGQEVEHVPCEPHDVRLDGVLTERGLRLFGPG